jgi:hypothetical protein
LTQAVSVFALKDTSIKALLNVLPARRVAGIVLGIMKIALNAKLTLAPKGLTNQQQLIHVLATTGITIRRPPSIAKVNK